MNKVHYMMKYTLKTKKKPHTHHQLKVALMAALITMMTIVMMIPVFLMYPHHFTHWSYSSLFINPIMERTSFSGKTDNISDDDSSASELYNDDIVSTSHTGSDQSQQIGYQYPVVSSLID